MALTMQEAPITTIPAATLILFDESSPGPARHLMLERSAAMAFAPGALVFPGGRVEADDHAIAASPALAHGAPADSEDAAARVAAIRETLEETGLAVAIRPVPAPETVLSWRAALKSGAPFGPLLAAGGHALALNLLVPFARWRPQIAATRMFDTRFYAARSEGETAAAHDTDEAVRHVWLTAAAALAEAAEGRHHIVFPTARNLERLAAHPCFERVLAHLIATPWRVITPERRDIHGVKHLCIPEGAGYPVTAAPF